MTAALTLPRARRNGAWLLLGANVYDIGITWVALRLGAAEANPISAWFIHSWPGGIAWLFAIKVALCVGIIAGATHHKVEESVLTTVAVWYVAGIYSLVVVLNTLVVAVRL